MSSAGWYSIDREGNKKLVRYRLRSFHDGKTEGFTEGHAVGYNQGMSDANHGYELRGFIAGVLGMILVWTITSILAPEVLT